MAIYNEFEKILLVTMLPGLGKSTLAKNHKHVIDYEDWMEARGLKYKSRGDRTAWNHLNEMLFSASEVTDDESTLYVFSSIHWEDMDDRRIKSGLFIHMKDGLYDCEELSSRGRSDLCKFEDSELCSWNDDYSFMTDNKNSIQLDKKEFVTIESIVSKKLDTDCMMIKDGMEIITDDNNQQDYV